MNKTSREILLALMRDSDIASNNTLLTPGLRYTLEQQILNLKSNYFKDVSDIIDHSNSLSINNKQISLMKDWGVLLSSSKHSYINNPVNLRHFCNKFYLINETGNIVVLDSNMSFLAYLGKTGTNVSSGEYYNPTDIAYDDKTKILYIACPELNCVQCYLYDANKTGQLVYKSTIGNISGGEGINNEKLTSPVAIAVGSNSVLYIGSQYGYANATLISGNDPLTDIYNVGIGDKTKLKVIYADEPYSPVDITLNIGVAKYLSDASPETDIYQGGVNTLNKFDIKLDGDTAFRTVALNLKTNSELHSAANPEIDLYKSGLGNKKSFLFMFEGEHEHHLIVLGITNCDTGAKIAAEIQSKLRDVISSSHQSYYDTITCTYDGVNKKYLFTATNTGYMYIYTALNNDASVSLKLTEGTTNKIQGVELTTGISIASEITNRVKEMTFTPDYATFECFYYDGIYQMTSGITGSIVIQDAGSDNVVPLLKLLPGTSIPGLTGNPTDTGIKVAEEITRQLRLYGESLLGHTGDKFKQTKCLYNLSFAPDKYIIYSPVDMEIFAAASNDAAVDLKLTRETYLKYNSNAKWNPGYLAACKYNHNTDLFEDIEILFYAGMKNGTGQSYEGEASKISDIFIETAITYSAGIAVDYIYLIINNNEIGKYNSITKEVMDTYRKPRELDSAVAFFKRIYKMKGDARLFVACDNLGQILAIDPVTHDLNGYFGELRDESGTESPESLGIFYDISGLIVINNIVYVADYHNKRVQRFSKSLIDANEFYVTYSPVILPDDIKLIDIARTMNDIKVERYNIIDAEDKEVSLDYAKMKDLKNMKIKLYFKPQLFSDKTTALSIQPLILLLEDVNG